MAKRPEYEFRISLNLLSQMAQLPFTVTHIEIIEIDGVPTIQCRGIHDMDVLVRDDSMPKQVVMQSTRAIHVGNSVLTLFMWSVVPEESTETSA